MKKEIFQKLLEAQRNEITEYLVYKKLSNRAKKSEEKKILKRIAEEEKNHYEFLKSFTGKDVKPNEFKVWLYYFISLIFGFSFAAKLMENSEKSSKSFYQELKGVDKKLTNFLIKQEDAHEKKIISFIDEKHLSYVGSFVLGLSAAIIELSGTLMGLTFAFQKTLIIAMVGIVAGIAASLSMAASEFLSKKEEGDKSPLKASFFTGTAYIVTVIIMILPYLIFSNHLMALSASMILAFIIVFLFNFYISVVKYINFWKRFKTMILIIFLVAFINFMIGTAIRLIFGINV